MVIETMRIDEIAHEECTEKRWKTRRQSTNSDSQICSVWALKYLNIFKIISNV